MSKFKVYYNSEKKTYEPFNIDANYLTKIKWITYKDISTYIDHLPATCKWAIANTYLDHMVLCIDTLISNSSPVLGELIKEAIYTAIKKEDFTAIKVFIRFGCDKLCRQILHTYQFPSHPIKQGLLYNYELAIKESEEINIQAILKRMKINSTALPIIRMIKHLKRVRLPNA